jgi:hypothetical protein
MRISDDRMALRSVRICDAQPGIFGGADRSFVARQHEQPGSLHIAIDREQSRGLRPFQHLTATLARRVQDGRHLEDECASLRRRRGCSRSLRAVRLWSAGVTSAPLRLQFSEILLTVILAGLVVAISGELILLVRRHHQYRAAHFGSLVGRQSSVGETLRRRRLFSCPYRYSWQAYRCDLAVLILFPLETSCERAQADRPYDSYGDSQNNRPLPFSSPKTPRDNRRLTGGTTSWTNGECPVVLLAVRSHRNCVLRAFVQRGARNQHDCAVRLQYVASQFL